jgi:hypothetical protein
MSAFLLKQPTVFCGCILLNAIAVHQIIEAERKAQHNRAAHEAAQDVDQEDDEEGEENDQGNQRQDPKS